MLIQKKSKSNTYIKTIMIRKRS